MNQYWGRCSVRDVPQRDYNSVPGSFALGIGCKVVECKPGRRTEAVDDRPGSEGAAPAGTAAELG